jgi:hypothetical protein
MIYVKTEAGRQALKERAESMPRKYHFPFLACDGVRDAADILRTSAAQGFTEADLQYLTQLGFIAPVVNAIPAATPAAMVKPTAEQAPTAALTVSSFVEAKHMATAITAKLGLRGFMLNMSVEGVSNVQELRALLPKIQAAVGEVNAKPLADLLKIAGA